MRFRHGISAAILGVPIMSCPASAQQNFGHAFVSGTGTDSGVCNRVAPCRTFAYATGQVPAGGQIFAIDTADYGTVTITKSLTVAAADGVSAIVHGDGSADGITVNAGAGDVVNLRGLAIETVPTGVNINGGNVNLEHSTITGGTFGIIVGSGGKTTVSDTTITGPTDTGIVAQSGSLVLDGVSLVGKGTTAVRPQVSATLTDVTIVGWGTGVFSTGSTFVKRSTITGSVTGVIVGGGTITYLDTTTITGCSTGVSGSFNSYGNNNIVGNTSNISGSKTSVQTASARPGARGVAR